MVTHNKHITVSENLLRFGLLRKILQERVIRKKEVKRFRMWGKVFDINLDFNPKVNKPIDDKKIYK